jgi:uracil-DNA glycosylase
LTAPNRLQQPLGTLLDQDHGDWQPLLEAWRQSAAGQALIQAVDARVAAGAVVYPADAFRALRLTPLWQTKVVILGQDPYHGSGQAEGLAFSVPAGQRVPPSLRNIFKELARDLGGEAALGGSADSRLSTNPGCPALTPPGNGSLVAWAQQGVLLLNTSLTVEGGQAGAHAKLGWHALTDAICIAASRDNSAKAFLLWGNHAQAKLPFLVEPRRHLVLQSNHPSPLSAMRPPLPFLGCGHFGQVNRFLVSVGRSAVDWGWGAAEIAKPSRLSVL